MFNVTYSPPFDIITRCIIIICYTIRIIIIIYSNPYILRYKSTDTNYYLILFLKYNLLIEIK